jgi:hypothetical protein
LKQGHPFWTMQSVVILWSQRLCHYGRPEIVMDLCLNIGDHVKSFSWTIQRVCFSLESDCYKQKLTTITHSLVLQLQMLWFWDSPQNGVDSCLV